MSFEISSNTGLFFWRKIMRIELGNWYLEKAANAKETDKLVPIRMVANRLDVDKENQQILPQAFNKSTVGKFLKHGIIDWHHVSVTGKTPEQRAQAIIGKPYDFKWEDDLPVVYGYLTKAHPIVRDSILPHLEADQKVFGASIGGNIKKARNVLDPGQHRPKEQILEIDWEHISVAASPYVISSGSEVTMVKAKGSEQPEPIIKFTDITALEQDFDLTCMSGEEIRKALTVGAGTDISTLTGVDALRQQSKQREYNYATLVEEVALGLQDDSIGGTAKGVKLFLKSKGLSQQNIEDFMSRFKKTIGLVTKDLN